MTGYKQYHATSQKGPVSTVMTRAFPLSSLSGMLALTLSLVPSGSLQLLSDRQQEELKGSSLILVSTLLVFLCNICSKVYISFWYNLRLQVCSSRRKVAERDKAWAIL